MRCIAALLCILVAGCVSAPPRIVQTPSVCPAPREKPTQALAAAAALPTELPSLPTDLNPDAAAVSVLVQRRQAAEQYHRALEVIAGLAAWIRQ